MNPKIKTNFIILFNGSPMSLDLHDLLKPFMIINQSGNETERCSIENRLFWTKEVIKNRLFWTKEVIKILFIGGEYEII